MLFRPTLSVFLLLAACSAIVPSTAARLATVDPLTADPGSLALVVVFPRGLAVSPGAATLNLAAVRGSESLAGSFRLEDRPAPADVALPAGATARGFALSGPDAERMRSLQAQIAGWEREGEAKASFGLGLGACTIGEGPAPEATGSILIRLNPDSPFLPMIRDGRLTDLLGAEALAAIKPCQGAE